MGVKMVLGVTILGILVAMGLTLLRACIGPTIFDRALAMNLFGTLSILFIALLGFFTGRPDFLDIALLYALLNFLIVTALLRVGVQPAAKRKKELL